MFIFFLILTVLFSTALTAGFAWSLVVRGHITRRSGRQVGAEVMAKTMHSDAQDQGSVLSSMRSKFWGKGFNVKGEASYSYAEIKKMLAEGRFLQALPSLLMMTGLVGLTFFLGCTLLTFPGALVGGMILLGFSMCCVYLILTGFLFKK
jgi:hypothetical protein